MAIDKQVCTESPPSRGFFVVWPLSDDRFVCNPYALCAIGMGFLGLPRLKSNRELLSLKYRFNALQVIEVNMFFY
ncbi:hypothetical protein GME_04597 [Halomonas sp. TD01]|nr:hypothetical protein GME_04597 [Halomonas sp. TD01]